MFWQIHTWDDGTDDSVEVKNQSQVLLLESSMLQALKNISVPKLDLGFFKKISSGLKDWGESVSYNGTAPDIKCNTEHCPEERAIQLVLVNCPQQLR